MQSRKTYILPSIDQGTGGAITVTLKKADQSAIYSFIRYDSASNSIIYSPQSPSETITSYNIIIQLTNSISNIQYTQTISVLAPVGETFQQLPRPIQIQAGLQQSYTFPDVNINAGTSPYDLFVNGLLDFECNSTTSCPGSWDIFSNTYSFNIPNDFVPGVYTLYIRLTDNAQNNYYAFNLTVTGPNQRPYWTQSLLTITAVKGIPISNCTPAWTDPEGDAVIPTLNAQDLVAFVQITIIDYTAKTAMLSINVDLSVTAQAYTIILTLSDSYGDFDTPVTINVIENQPPTFNTPSFPQDQTIAVNYPQMIYPLSGFSDPEGQSVTLTLTCESCPDPTILPPFLSLSATYDLIMNPPANAQYIGQSVRLKVVLEDQSLKQTTYHFMVNVPNQLPVFGNTAAYSPPIIMLRTDPGQTFDLQSHFQASDPDQPVQTIYYQLQSTEYAKFIYINRQGQMTVYPDVSIPTGQYTITFFVCDGISFIYQSVMVMFDKPPYFVGNSIPDTVMTCCGQEPLMLPRALDDESNNQFTISFDITSPLLITLASRQWLIDTSLLPQPQVVAVTLTDNNGYHSTYSFNIKLNHRPIFMKSPSDQEILAGQSREYSLQDMGADSDAGDVISTVLRYQNSTDLPSFMTSNNSILTLSPSANMQTSFFDMEMRVSDSYAESLSCKTFRVTVLGVSPPVKVNTGPPFFDGLDTFPDISMKLQDTYKVTFPPIKDPDGDQYSIMILDFSSLGLFMFCTLSLQAFVIKPTDSSHAGIYPIVIVLKDNNKQQLSQRYNFMLEIRDPEFDNANVNNQDTSDDVDLSDESSNPTTEEIETISDKDEDLFLSIEKPNKESKKVYLPRRIIKDRNKLSYDLKARVESVDTVGEMNVIFNRDVKIPTYFQSFNQSFIQLTLITDPKEVKAGRVLLEGEVSKQLVNFNWTMNKFSSRKFTIDIQFDQPLEVSNEQTHYLQTKFVQNGYFVDKITGKPIGLNYTMVSKLPKQMIKDDISKFFGKNAEQIKTTLSATLQTNFLANIFLQANIIFLNINRSSSLQFLWGMVNVLQLIVRVPLFAIKFPANSQVLFGILIDITNFSFFSMQSVESALFKFTPTSPLNENFNALGYNTRNSIKNAGMMFYYLILIIIIYALFLIFKGILKLMKIDETNDQLICKIYQWIKKQVVYSLILRFFMESYVELSIGALLQLRGFETETSSDRFAAFYGVIMSIFLLILPFALFILLRCNLAALKQKTDQSASFQAEYSTLLLNLRFKTEPASILYAPVFFLMRRLLFSMSALFLEDYPLFQVQLLFAQSVGVMAFLLRVRPFEERSMVILEIFNEMCIYLVTFPVLLFSGMTEDLKTDYNLGWLLVFAVLFNILVNMTVLLVINAKGMLSACKRWRRRRITDNMIEVKSKGSVEDNKIKPIEKPQAEIKARMMNTNTKLFEENPHMNTNQFFQTHKGLNVRESNNVMDLIQQESSRQDHQKEDQILNRRVKRDRYQNKYKHLEVLEDIQDENDILEVRRKRRQEFDDV